MKKIIAYTAVLAALMAVSCSRMEENDLAGLHSSVITLSLNPSEMVETRSAIPAVESVVKQFDWFFYQDATGTSAPVYHGHFTVGEGGTLTPSGTNTPNAYTSDTEGYHLGFDIENDVNYKNLKGSYYVYVLANYEGIDHSASDLTLATLLAKTMETNWDEKSKSYTAINDFVMDSYSGNDKATYPQLVPLSAAKDDDKDGKANLAVDLQRVAVKISFTLNIKKEIVDDPVAKTKWRPLTKSANYTTNFVNALTYATVKGNTLDAESSLAIAHHLSYDNSHVKTEKTATETTYTWEVDPFYTYPVSFNPGSNNAPYFKLALPWENVDESGHLTGKGSTVFYYKAYLRDEEGKALTSFERNKHYIVTLNVDVLGGTPEDYTILDTYYYVANWQSPIDGTYDGYFAPRYLDIARSVYYLYGDNSITIAVTSSHPISAQIVGTPSQIDINNKQRITGITYNVQQDAYTLSLSQVWYTDAQSPQQRTATGTNTARVSTDGKVSFTLNYQMNTELGGDPNKHLMDLTPITWNLKIYHTDAEDVFKNVTIKQYPSIYLELNHTDAYNGASTFLDAYQFPNPDASTHIYARSGNDGTQRNGTNLGDLGGGGVDSRDKTIFTVSTLSSLIGGDFDGMVIGDPRVPFSTLTEEERTHQGRTWGIEDLGKYDEGDFDKYLFASPDKRNFVAPRFMFASGHMGSNTANGNVNTGGSWRSAAERCAAYQEDGYPAGRWRLPTDAEIRFCRQIQASGYITGLFYYSNPYWAASGDYFRSGTMHEPDNNTHASVRCVYDLWYWGEESYNDNGVQIKEGVTPNTAATVWLGYMTE